MNDVDVLDQYLYTDTMHVDPVFMIYGYSEWKKQKNSPTNKIKQPNISKYEHTEITTKRKHHSRGGNKI